MDNVKSSSSLCDNLNTYFESTPEKSARILEAVKKLGEQQPSSTDAKWLEVKQVQPRTPSPLNPRSRLISAEPTMSASNVSPK